MVGGENEENGAKMVPQTDAKEKVQSWTSPWTGVFLMLFAAMGIGFSYALQDSEITALKNPDTLLSCDVNPLIGCSESLLAPQGHLLGVPNSAIGMLAFGVIIALGSVLAFGGSLPRIVWWGFTAGMTGGLVYVIYFLVQSVAVFRTLCPYCMGIWAAILGIAPLVICGALCAGAFGSSAKRAGKSLMRYWLALVLLLYLLVALVVVVTMSDKIALVFA